MPFPFFSFQGMASPVAGLAGLTPPPEFAVLNLSLTAILPSSVAKALTNYCKKAPGHWRLIDRRLKKQLTKYKDNF